MRSEVATSCWAVGSSRSLRAEPTGQVASSPVKHCSELPVTPVTRAVFRAEIQYLTAAAVSCTQGAVRGGAEEQVQASSQW